MNFNLNSKKRLSGFRCANHKLNIAIREAIKMHPEIIDILSKLNRSNGSIRRSIQLNYAFKSNKCRLRLENNTRWSSAYLLLESVKKAYDRNMFVDESCPVSKELVEVYLQILKHSYCLSIQFQSTNSSIADTVPNILKLISVYKTLNVPDSAKNFCKFIVTQLKHKFHFELEQSCYYHAAPLLKVSTLQYWLGKPYTDGYLAKVLEDLPHCARLFCFNQMKLVKILKLDLLKSLIQLLVILKRFFQIHLRKTKRSAILNSIWKFSCEMWRKK